MNTVREVTLLLVGGIGAAELINTPVRVKTNKIKRILNLGILSFIFIDILEKINSLFFTSIVDPAIIIPRIKK
ncbi:MAG: hypothetical protein P8Y25_13565, partial [Chromatiaceae bacterium]